MLGSSKLLLARRSSHLVDVGAGVRGVNALRSAFCGRAHHCVRWNGYSLEKHFDWFRVLPRLLKYASLW